jgi:G patch domain-containing protein 1
MAAGDSDSEDYITVGTPIERELEARAGARKAAAQDPGSTKALPVWKQAATDEQGRRRFHGAFTGGFSAGYYNTVGS